MTLSRPQPQDSGMARGGKSALSAGASPVPHAAAKKRKSEALLKDLLGVATQDDGPVRPNSAALRSAMLLFAARGFATLLVPRAAADDLRRCRSAA